MKANELRIGNWVICHFMNMEIKTQVLWMTYNILEQKYFANVKDGEVINAYSIETNCKPIPITPELLERCGFVISGDVEWVIPLPNGNGCDLFLEHILADNTIPYDVVLRAEKHFIYLHSITYLHQLQNLYHALTGNELEVKM